MKKCICALLIAALLLTCFVPVTFAKTTVGDVDGVDGITPADARLALRISLGLMKDGNTVMTAEMQARADADGKNGVQPADARLILRAALGLASVSADGTYIEDLTAADKLRNFMVANGTLYNGVYLLGVTSEEGGLEITYLFCYDPADSEPFSVEVYYESDDLAYDTIVSFSTSFMTYHITFYVFDPVTDDTYIIAYYLLSNLLVSGKNPEQCVALIDYEGDTSVQSSIRTIAAESAWGGLAVFASYLQEMNAGLDYDRDLHLPYLFDGLDL